MKEEQNKLKTEGIEDWAIWVIFLFMFFDYKKEANLESLAKDLEDAGVPGNVLDKVRLLRDKYEEELNKIYKNENG